MKPCACGCGQWVYKGNRKYTPTCAPRVLKERRVAYLKRHPNALNMTTESFEKISLEALHLNITKMETVEKMISTYFKHVEGDEMEERR